MDHPLSPKDRLRIQRQAMPEEAASERARNFREVNKGLDAALAHREALRCLECRNPRCVSSCPVGVKVREFVELVVAGDYLGAAAKIREDNALPSVTGRVCPQETQCEGACILGNRSEPLAIGYLERFVADFERQSGEKRLPPAVPSTGKRVAIVGSGPAGLSCAGDLILKGHQVTVLEALHDIGGVLIYGIPEFRLPKAIVREEVDRLAELGVEFKTNVVVGPSVTLDELMKEEGYDAVFVATGAGLPLFMNIPGEHLCGVYSANEFLTRVNLMKAHEFPAYDSPVYDCRDRDVMVFGGGNTAMDAVRMARRLGARSAQIVYRRSLEELPARTEEVKHAREEGVEFTLLTAPVEFLGDDAGRLTSVKLQRMELGNPDASGRRSPQPVPGSEHVVPVHMAIVAIGNRGNPLVPASTPDLTTSRHGYILADPGSLKTSKRGVFAGGDIVTGGATVILAMGAGRKAAKAIHEYLTDPVW